MFHRSVRDSRRWIGFLAVGCLGCASPLEPVAPPSGGTELTLDFATYQRDVAPILLSQGCSTAECHGGGIRGTYELSPLDAPNAQFDFEQTAIQVNVAELTASPILAEPLAESAGGTPHQHEPFASIWDSDYQTILAWIEAGVQ
ncbi:MAG: hypothetical protein DHS20C21_04330 [Gemmatimonadota bacterium]|nr:MAG: hypothetical protein DHS20C21_04330 [Gemmatimonadota bacterium]